MPTACLIIIGNEILSGRTQEKNLGWLAVRLNERGIRLAEARVIPDSEETIVTTVNECRKRCDYLFTSGGIGPTHDDITAAAIAKAFGVPVLRHPEAERRLLAHYRPEQINEARMKMADMPQGASLIDNPVSIAPGFRLENVYVLAGVPAIFQAMVDSLLPGLAQGEPMLSRTVSAYATEGNIASELAAIQQHFPQVEIGSYPFMKDGRLGTSLVARGTDTDQLDAVSEELRKLMLRYAKEIITD